MQTTQHPINAKNFVVNLSKREIESRLSKLEARKAGNSPLNIEAILESIRSRHENPNQAMEQMRDKYQPRIDELDESDLQQSVLKRIMINTTNRGSLHA